MNLSRPTSHGLTQAASADQISPASPTSPATPTVTPLEPQQRAVVARLNPLLQTFLTIIAGVVVAVIAWNVIEHFLHIIVLLIASFLLAYLLGPLADRLERRGMARALSVGLIYLGIIGVIAVGAVLLIGPLTNQLQGLVKALPTLVTAQAGAPSGIDQFFQEQNIPLSVADLRTRLVEYLGSAGTELLGSTLAVVAGLVTLVTDILLVLAITFYLLLDGRAMHNWALRFLPTTGRERWFFVEATLNRVLGGYIRGQLIVALTVGAAAGIGSFVLGVQYPLVIGLLAFLFEFIPLVGPVLGMIPAVVIAYFQSPSLALWTVVYFILLQQVEANVIVPRVSGHAVGLHPLAVLLALLAGVELGGLSGALLAVPVAGVLYVLALALYMDKTGQTELLVAGPRRTAYRSLRHAIGRRRTQSGQGGSIAGIAGGSRNVAPPATPGATLAVGINAGRTDGANVLDTPPTPTVAIAGNDAEIGSVGARSSSSEGAVATTSNAVGALPVESAAHERLATIAQEQAQLIAKFEADEIEQANVEASAAASSATSPGTKSEADAAHHKTGPDDTHVADVPA